MKNACIDLLKHLYANGYHVRLIDEDIGTTDEQYFEGPMLAWNEINEYDGGCNFSVHEDVTDRHISTVITAIGYGNEPDENIADWSTSGGDQQNIVDEWCDLFY